MERRSNHALPANDGPSRLQAPRLVAAVGELGSCLASGAHEFKASKVSFFRHRRLALFGTSHLYSRRWPGSKARHHEVYALRYASGQLRWPCLAADIGARPNQGPLGVSSLP